MTFRLLICFSLSLVVFASAAPTPDFFRRHCIDCHGPDEAKAEIRFDQPLDLETWDLVLEQLEAEEMPPRKRDRPAAADLEGAIAWVRDQLNSDSSELPPLPIRRLNRAEYANTIRDLFEIAFPVGESIPQDGSAHGFDNVGDALTLSPLLLEKYLKEAERITERVLLTEPAEPFHAHWVGNDLVYQKAPNLRIDDAVVFQTVGRSNGGGAFFPLPIPFKQLGYKMEATGLYRMKIHMHPTGPLTNPSSRWRLVHKPEHFEQPEPVGVEAPRMHFVIEGRQAARIHLENREPTTYEFTTWAEEGEKFGFTFENGVGGVGRGSEKKFKGPMIVVHWVELEGPLDETWRSWFSDQSLRPQDANALLTRFVSRAFRRPATEEEIDQLAGICESELAAGSEDREALAASLQRVLCSPQFLFLNQTEHTPAGFQLASRLSYFLWSTTPDDELLLAAADGSLLADPEPQIRRMLTDPRSDAFVSNFTGQWLNIRHLQDIAVDRPRFPDFNDYLRTLFVRETESFFREILDHDLSILNFVDSDFAMLNDRLAFHYGIEGVEGHEFRRVALKPEHHRGGVMTHASVLTLTTCGSRTSPILRGTWVMESLLGLHVPPPPKDVPELPAAPRGNVSQRARLEAHRDVEACAKCHDRIDPLGFPLEHYDVIGRWRTDYGLRTRYGQQGGPDVDGSAVFTSGHEVAGPDEMRKFILENRSELFVRGFVERLMTYALGRGLTPADRPAIDRLTENLAKNEFRMSDLIVDIVKTEAFQPQP